MSSNHSLEYLLNGYIRLCCDECKIYIPSTIIHIIHGFCGFGLHTAMHLFAIRSTKSLDTHIQLFNIWNTNVIYTSFAEIQTLHTSDFYNQFTRYKPSTCTLNNITLPIPFQHKLQQIFPSYPSIKDKWSMFAFIGGRKSDNTPSESCHICGLQPSQITNKTVRGCNFAFPALPHPFFKLSVIYDKYNNKLYSLNARQSGYRKSIFASNLNALTMEELNWKSICNEDLILDRYSVSSCIIDKGRFIAILGGKTPMCDYKDVELYALNLNKSIKLSSMNENRVNEPCVYNEILYSIIIGGGKSFEVYDINKDYWKIVFERPDHKLMDNHQASNVWISDSDPNIFFYCGLNSSGDYFVVEGYDLRQHLNNTHRFKVFNCKVHKKNRSNNNIIIDGRAPLATRFPDFNDMLYFSF